MDNKTNVKNINLSVIVEIQKDLAKQNHIDSSLSNYLNIRNKNIDHLIKGKEELNIKDLYLLNKHYKVDIDSIFEKVFKNIK